MSVMLDICDHLCTCWHAFDAAALANTCSVIIAATKCSTELNSIMSFSKLFHCLIVFGKKLCDHPMNRSTVACHNLNASFLTYNVTLSNFCNLLYIAIIMYHAVAQFCDVLHKPINCE